MPQNRHTGAEGNRFGHDCGARVAVALGTRLLGGASNECILNGERVVIKCARKGTPDVGITYRMVQTLDAVVGAFEDASGLYRILRLPAYRCKNLMQMKPTRSHGPSARKVGKVPKSVFEHEGTLLSVVRI